MLIKQITLDARTTSSLDWQWAYPEAEKWAAIGYLLYWKLDLGLFSQLLHPIKNETQCRTLGLALEHFAKSLGQTFEKVSLGLSLYQGSLDFSKEIPTRVLEDPYPTEKLLYQLYCRDLALDYLNILIAYLPHAIQPFITANDMALPFLAAKEKHGALQIAFEREGELFFQQDKESTIGICLPAADCYDPKTYQQLEEIIHLLNTQKKKYRIISEGELTMEWDLLDTLYVAPEGVSAQGERKLRGFEAAGGVVEMI